MSQTSQAIKNLRTLAVVQVISFHSVLAYLTSQLNSYVSFDSPPYTWLATPVLDAQRWFGFDLYAAFLYLWMMPLMFFLSGIFVWGSLARKGAWQYFANRALRIGLPFLLGVFLLMPIAYYPAYRIRSVDPSWFGYFQRLLALPFWPSGPLWFLWELLAFDIAAVLLYLFAFNFIERLKYMASLGSQPWRYFLLLFTISVLSYLPLAYIFGASQWGEFGPFALQTDRPLLYLVYFFAGVGIGAYGYERGLLAVDGLLSRHWHLWCSASLVTFMLWMSSMAPSYYGRSGIVYDLISGVSLVLAIATGCFALLGLFLRFFTSAARLTDSVAKHAYGIYLVHYIFVVWLQYFLLSMGLPAIIKGLLVMSVAFLMSWGSALIGSWLADKTFRSKIRKFQIQFSTQNRQMTG